MILYLHLQLLLFRGDTAALVGEGVTIPAMSITERAMGGMTAYRPVEAAAPALSVAGFDRLADLRGRDLVGDGLPC